MHGSGVSGLAATACPRIEGSQVTGPSDRRRRPTRSAARASARSRDALGVSIGTVDRALHDRPGHQPGTRGQRPGHRQGPGVSAEPRRALPVLAQGATHRRRPSPPDRRPSGTSSATASRTPRGPWRRTGVKVLVSVLSPPRAKARGKPSKRSLRGGHPRPRDRARRAGEAQAPDPPRPRAGHLGPLREHRRPRDRHASTAVAVDPVTSGSLVGELMGRFLQGRGRVVLVTGPPRHHRPRPEARGLSQDRGGDVARTSRSRGSWKPTTTRGRPTRSAARCSRPRPEIAGVYVSTANSLPVLRALEDEGLPGGRSP